jgi:hypothetical protein
VSLREAKIFAAAGEDRRGVQEKISTKKEKSGKNKSPRKDTLGAKISPEDGNPTTKFASEGGVFDKVNRKMQNELFPTAFEGKRLDMNAWCKPTKELFKKLKNEQKIQAISLDEAEVCVCVCVCASARHCAQACISCMCTKVCMCPQR